MDQLIVKLSKLDIVRSDVDLHLVRAAMIVVFFVFGCQKWFDYEAHALIPFISHGPLIFWLYPVFGVRGAAFFLGSAEWVIGALMFFGFWSRKAAILGSLGSCATYVATVTIIPFFPDAWAAPAGGFPAATLPFLFLVKDIVLLAASIYLLKQDILRASGKACDATVRASTPPCHLTPIRSRWAGITEPIPSEQISKVRLDTTLRPD